VIRLGLWLLVRLRQLVLATDDLAGGVVPRRPRLEVRTAGLVAHSRARQIASFKLPERLVIVDPSRSRQVADGKLPCWRDLRPESTSRASAVIHNRVDDLGMAWPGFRHGSRPGIAPGSRFAGLSAGSGPGWPFPGVWVPVAA